MDFFADQRIINHEKDFVLVSPSNKCIIVIESKSTLGAGGSINKSMDQLLNTKADLESYITSDVLTDNPWMSSEWVFVPMIYCEEVEQGVEISQTSEDFVIRGKYLYSFNTVENSIQQGLGLHGNIWVTFRQKMRCNLK